MASIGFSAQFGGRDAADAVLPHFRALKVAAEGIEIHGFPVGELSFILRVDGAVREYEQCGVGRPDYNPRDSYLSIDIGVPIAARANLVDYLSDAISGSDDLIIQSLPIDAAVELDRDTLKQALRTLVVQFRQAFDSADTPSLPR